MNKNIIITLSVIGSLLVLYFLMSITYTNKEIELRNQVMSQQEVIKLNFDKMFKVISQVAQVPEQAKKTFKEIYTPLIEGRYNNDRGGALMSWITENNPTFDFKLYERVQVVIEANREEFFIEQKKLVDYNREHAILLNKFPSRLFLYDVKEIEIITVTSDKTAKAFQTGQENDINIFGE